MNKYIRLLSVIILLTFIAPLIAHGQVLFTIAGNGLGDSTGDGGSARNATLHWPKGIAVDAHGNVFIADSYNNMVRKVDTNGIITTIAGNGFEAGNGTGGFGGDGGAATAARLYFPSGVAVDTSGNVYIADASNHRIRKVGTGGIITTFAGTGVNGYAGDGGAATAAQLYQPSHVIADTFGNVFIADEINNCIRKVDPSGIISTYAGNGTSGFSGDGGPAASAQLSHPQDMALDIRGDLYIVDEGNVRIRMVDTFGNIRSVAGVLGIHAYSGDGGPATAAHLDHPAGIAVSDSGKIYIADLGNSRIRMIDSGIITTVAGTGQDSCGGDGHYATATQLSFPVAVAVRGINNLYIVDQACNKVKVLRFDVGVHDVNSFSGNLSLYPNPGNGTFRLSLTTPDHEKARVSISDMTGKQVGAMEINTNQPADMVLNAPPGIYILTVMTSSRRWIEKIVVQ